MSFIEKNLQPGEQIMFRTKKHIIIFLVPVLWTLLIFIFLFNSNPFIQKAAFLAAICAIATWSKELLNYYTSEFAVTDKRIVMKEGFFFRHTNETRLTTIANVTINQNLLAQMLDYGTVLINTFGGETDPFSQIASPIQFQNHALAQLEKLTQK